MGSTQRWQVGDVTITKVVELEMAEPITWLIPRATREELAAVPWLRPHFVNHAGDPILSVHALVIESEGRRIVVDTCIGNDKPRPREDWDHLQGSFLQDLAVAGLPAESIDTVLCTHLHVDHVGWNTRWVDGRWVPTFPRARYVFARSEFEYWSANPELQMGDVMGDSVQPVVDAGLVDLVETDHVVTSEVRLEPTPGHTPGHVAVRIRSRGEEAVITGDLLHHPIQYAHPDWPTRVDTDREEGLRTRQAFMAAQCDQPVLVIGTHVPSPTAGHVVRDGDVYRLEV